MHVKNTRLITKAVVLNGLLGHLNKKDLADYGDVWASDPGAAIFGTLFLPIIIFVLSPIILMLQLFTSKNDDLHYDSFVQTTHLKYLLLFSPVLCLLLVWLVE